MLACDLFYLTALIQTLTTINTDYLIYSTKRLILYIPSALP